jgi:hypothetical protein
MKNPQLFIAYFYRDDDTKDAELYVGQTGDDKEFQRYWKRAYGETMKKSNIDTLCPIVKEMGIDGKEYNIAITEL